jgi:hypothetical protein
VAAAASDRQERKTLEARVAAQFESAMGAAPHFSALASLAKAFKIGNGRSFDTGILSRICFPNCFMIGFCMKLP